MLIQNRYDPKKIFFHQERITQLLKQEMPTPVCIEIDPADGYCNQSCKDCSYESNKKKTIRLINTKLLVDTLFELKQSGVLSIEWVGGSEPTLHPDISLFISTARKLGLKSGVVTNGVLLKRIYPNIINGDVGVITAGGDMPFCIRHRNHPEFYIGNIPDVAISPNTELNLEFI